MASPNESASDSVPENDTSATPPTHSTAASRLYRVGLMRENAHAKNGVMTQYVEVRKALFDAVVSVKPVVLNIYAGPTNSPSSTPATSTSRLICCATVRQKTTSKITPAETKRRPTSHNGGKAVTVSLSTTVPMPQMAAASTSMLLYTQAGMWRFVCCAKCFMRPIVSAACRSAMPTCCARYEPTHTPQAAQ